MSHVTRFAPASAADAGRHFESKLRFETDCWDVHASLQQDAGDFVLLDVRSAGAYARGHIDGAINLPHPEISADTLAGYPQDVVFVTYCAGPHCNGADQAALKIARCGRPVKIMIGGVTGWLDEGFRLVSSNESNEY